MSTTLIQELVGLVDLAQIEETRQVEQEGFLKEPIVLEGLLGQFCVVEGLLVAPSPEVGLGVLQVADP